MSGTGYNPASQQVAANFQAWLPPVATIPAGDQSGGSQWAPYFLYGGAQVFGRSHARSLQTVYNIWWTPADPQPTLPKVSLVQGAGASFSIFHPTWQVTVLASWIDPDPLPTLPIQRRKIFTPGILPVPAPTPANAVSPPHNVAANGAIPVFITTNSASLGAVPKAGTANTVVNAGVAIVAVIGPISGGFIYNPPNAASQGIQTAEDINLDMTGPPLAGDTYGYGTTTTLTAGQTFTLPALAPGVQVWINAVTAGHRITAVTW